MLSGYPTTQRSDAAPMTADYLGVANDAQFCVGLAAVERAVSKRPGQWLILGGPASVVADAVFDSVQVESGGESKRQRAAETNEPVRFRADPWCHSRRMICPSASTHMQNLQLCFLQQRTRSLLRRVLFLRLDVRVH